MGPVLKPIEEAGNTAVELPLHLYRRVYMREEEIRGRVKKQVADPIASQAYRAVIWNLKMNTRPWTL
jgi:hypothetical protein